MTSKNSINPTYTIPNHEKPFDTPSQEGLGSVKQQIKEAQMTYKALISAILLSSSLLAVSEAQARPDMTTEQLAKARQVASQMKPAIDLDTLLDEADRLGVVCEGDLTRRYRISMCNSAVNTAQSEKRQVKLDAENAKLEENITAKREKLAKILDETKEVARKKLNQ